MLSEIFSRVYDANGTYHDDVIKWKHFPRNWPFVQGIHRSPVNSAQRPETRSFDVFFHLRLSKRLRKQSWGCSFETTSRALWHHCNDITHLHRCTPLCILIHTVNPKWYIHGYDILCFTVAISSNSIGSMNLPIFIRVASLALPYRTRTHHGDVTWAPWRLKSPVTLLFIQLFVFVFVLFFWQRTKKYQRSALQALCEGTPSVASGFPAQRAGIAESGSVSWNDHGANHARGVQYISNTQNCMLQISIQNTQFNSKIIWDKTGYKRTEVYIYIYITYVINYLETVITVIGNDTTFLYLILHKITVRIHWYSWHLRFRAKNIIIVKWGIKYFIW